MKKIMFNDKFALTEAVLEGRKPMTRRIVPCSVVNLPLDKAMSKFPFHIEDIVAIAQSYRSISLGMSNPDEMDKFEKAVEKAHGCPYYAVAGWRNKMFVKAELMPHHIQIKDWTFEDLQDISDEDCLKEGIFARWHAPACRNYYYVPNVVVNHPDFVFLTPRDAYAYMIDKISGKGTWERNPIVLVYTYERID